MLLSLENFAKKVNLLCYCILISKIKTLIYPCLERKKTKNLKEKSHSKFFCGCFFLNKKIQTFFVLNALAKCNPTTKKLPRQTLAAFFPSIFLLEKSFNNFFDFFSSFFYPKIFFSLLISIAYPKSLITNIQFQLFHCLFNYTG